MKTFLAFIAGLLSGWIACSALISWCYDAEIVFNNRSRNDEEKENEIL